MITFQLHTTTSVNYDKVEWDENLEDISEFSMKIIPIKIYFNDTHQDKLHNINPIISQKSANTE